MEWLPTILGTVFGGLSGLSGVLFYRKQTGEAKELDNEAKRAELSERRANEWQELYEQMKQERNAKETLLVQKSQNINQLESEVSKLKTAVSVLECQKCEVYNCLKRKPPLKELWSDTPKEEKKDGQQS